MTLAVAPGAPSCRAIRHPRPGGAPDYPDSDLQLRGLRRPRCRALCCIAAEPTSLAVGFGSGSCPEFQPSQMMILAAADAVAVIIYLVWMWISNGSAVRRRVQRRTRTGTRTSHRPGQTGNRSSSCGMGGSCAREPEASAMRGRYQPAASRWMLGRASLVHRERVLRRAGSAGNADMP